MCHTCAWLSVGMAFAEKMPVFCNQNSIDKPSRQFVNRKTGHRLKSLGIDPSKPPSQGYYSFARPPGCKPARGCRAADDELRPTARPRTPGSSGQRHAFTHQPPSIPFTPSGSWQPTNSTTRSLLSRTITSDVAPAKTAGPTSPIPL